MQQQLVMMMERQFADISTGVSQFHSDYGENFDGHPLP